MAKSNVVSGRGVVVVFGSRSIEDLKGGPAWIRHRLRQLPRGTIVRSGGARGADQISVTVANALGFQTDEMKADWNKGGKYNPQAGFERNTAMLEKKPTPWFGICFWDRESTGALDTLLKAHKRKIPIEVNFVGGAQMLVNDRSDINVLLNETEGEKAQQKLLKFLRG